MTSVLTTFGVAKIFVCEQNLSHGEPVPAKSAFVAGHENILSNRSACLQIRDTNGTTAQPEPSHAGANRSGGDKHHTATGATQKFYLSRNPSNARCFESSIRTRQYAGA